MAGNDKKLPAKSSDRQVEDFLAKVAASPSGKPAGRRGRLIFAIDATASRRPTWDLACHLQSQMFEETASLGGLEIQLVYYRGFRDFQAGPWLDSSDDLVRLMTGVDCLGGRTQIRKVLRHAVAESKKRKADALVFVGDAMEEDVDALCHIAGELGLLGVPAFMFHEGQDPGARYAFEQIAQLSGGACCRFDAASAKQLRELLSAVAVYAAGGRRALEDYGRKRGGAALQITHQMR